MMSRPPGPVLPEGIDVANKDGEEGVTQGKQDMCVTGVLCEAPSGNDLAASMHHCVVCQLSLHCALWHVLLISQLRASNVSIVLLNIVRLEEFCPRQLRHPFKP